MNKWEEEDDLALSLSVVLSLSVLREWVIVRQHEESFTFITIKTRVWILVFN